LNFKRHGVTFEDASKVLGREDGHLQLVEDYDDNHSHEEDRYRTFGPHPEKPQVILGVSWTDRTNNQGQITRIISARPTDRRERKAYFQRIRQRNRSQEL
jgi:uncharacterized DUF497 family protein